MTEPNSTDHWAALAGDLGAKVPPAPEKPQAPDSAEAPLQASAPPPPIFKPAGKAVRPEKRPARPPAWDALAGDLGIEMPPQPAEPPPRKFEAVRPSPAAPIPQEEGSYRSPRAPFPQGGGNLAPAEMAAEIEAELTAWDDVDPTATEPRSFEPQEALDVMDETSEDFDEGFSGEAAVPSSEAAPAESEERHGRRRRRRGRGRNRDAVESAEVRSTDPDEEQPAADEAAAEYFDEDSDIERPAFGDGDEGDSEAVDADADAEESDDFGDDDEDGGESPRIGFRNIPTWHDAIGVMIAKNMESRARNPSGPRGPGGRGHGGRGGRGPGRGGRDRRPDRR
jgi:hypothetical protein